MDSGRARDLIHEVEEQCELLGTGFIDSLGPAGSEPGARLQRLFDVWRQVTLRRIVDLASAANLMFREGRLVPGCTLTRSVVETVSLHFMVWKKLEADIDHGELSRIHELLMQVVFGRRDKPDWPQKSIQVLTAVDHLDKQFPGFREEYERLCEYAHPGLSGGYGTYCIREGDDMQYRFGENPAGLEMGPWGQIELHRSLLVAGALEGFLEQMRPRLVAVSLGGS